MKKFGIIAACVVGVCIVVWFVAGVISGSRERREYDEAMAAAMDTSEELAFLGLDVEGKPSPSPTPTPVPMPLVDDLPDKVSKFRNMSFRHNVAYTFTINEDGSKFGQDSASLVIEEGKAFATFACVGINEEDAGTVETFIEGLINEHVDEGYNILDEDINGIDAKASIFATRINGEDFYGTYYAFSDSEYIYAVGYFRQGVLYDDAFYRTLDSISILAPAAIAPDISESDNEASPEPSVSQKPTPSADNPAPTPTPRATAKPTPEPAQSSSTGNAYQDILDEYSTKLKEAAPRLASEYRAEAANTSGGIDALAELSMEKIGELAEISVEGIGEMAEIQLRTGDYDEYEEWAGKLQDVYNDEAQKIMDAYMDSAM